jgi:hypothetical protein
MASKLNTLPDEAFCVVERSLDHFPQRLRERAAFVIVSALRDAGFFAGAVEQHYSAVTVARLLSRSPEYITQQVKRGAFGRVFRDGAGWMIPASGVRRWLEDRALSVEVRA